MAEEVKVPSLTNRDYTRKRLDQEGQNGRHDFGDKITLGKRKRRTKPELSSSELQAIIDHMMRHKWSQAQVAVKFMVKPALVHRLLTMYKLDPDFI